MPPGEEALHKPRGGIAIPSTALQGVSLAMQFRLLSSHGVRYPCPVSGLRRAESHVQAGRSSMHLHIAPYLLMHEQSQRLQWRKERPTEDLGAYQRSATRIFRICQPTLRVTKAGEDAFMVEGFRLTRKGTVRLLNV